MGKNGTENAHQIYVPSNIFGESQLVEQLPTTRTHPMLCQAWGTIYPSSDLTLGRVLYLV